MNFDVDTVITILCGIGILCGILGTIIPVLPGVLLCWASVLVWAIFAGDGWGRWVVLGIATMIALIGVLVQYAWPGKRMKEAGVPNRTLIIGGLCGIVGFFVLPFLGLPIGFVLGVWLAEQIRLQAAGPAWASTKHALKAAGLYLLIELASALTIATVWVAGLVFA
ncbi:DUF456 domain-containing protein [Catelliglobosispora koreensis]|uniref:DUF456 domain-containing protein n=1 Tax=Catelliglobosispora koreensis TaxID=129052 RepID=UPI00035CB355|nr:DUF456 domain-containing protein [Catelliglobosispora koreensis]